MRKVYIRKIFAVVMISTLLCISSTVNTEAKTSYEKISNKSEWQVLQKVNQERMKEGEPPLSMFKAIQEASGERAEELKSEFSHTRPDGSSCFSILEQKKIHYMASGENIAVGQKNATEVMKSWMNSEGHRANILSNAFQHIGIGYVTGGSYNKNWTQLFVGGCEANSIRVNDASKIKSYKKGTTIEQMNRYLAIECEAHGTAYMPVITKMCTGYNKSKLGTQKIKIKYQNYTKTITVKIVK